MFLLQEIVWELQDWHSLSPPVTETYEDIKSVHLVAEQFKANTAATLQKRGKEESVAHPAQLKIPFNVIYVKNHRLEEWDTFAHTNPKQSRIRMPSHTSEWREIPSSP